MTAVDTNVVVRFLTGDDTIQAAAAARLFRSGPVWIAKTVLLETNWVLRTVYGFDEGSVRKALRDLAGLAGVEMEDAGTVAAALDLTEHGVELADAMHLTSRPAGARFVSFDRSFIKRATRAGVAGVSTIESGG
jgi:predicted nucleic-acid-binding protein